MSGFTPNNDIVSLTNGNDSIDAGAGSDFVRGLGGNDELAGADGNDILLGGTGDDTLMGDDGDDLLSGGTGNDRLVGGAAIDQALYDLVVLTRDSFTANGSTWTVTATMQGAQLEGTDVLDGVEIVADASGNRTLLVGSGGFASIQAAVDAAIDGDTLLIAGGEYAGDVDISGKAITLLGYGSGVTVIKGKITVDGELTDKSVAFRDLTIDATGKTHGIMIESIGGSIVVDGAHIAHASVNGIFYAHPNNDSQTTTTTGLLEALSVNNTTFEDNGHYNGVASGPGGRGHINLFGFNGDLTLTDNQFSATGDGPQLGPIYKAVTVAGAGRPIGGVNQALLGTDASSIVQDQISPLASATITGNDFSGTYTQDLVSFYYFTSVALEASGNTTTGVTAPWGLLNLDAVGGNVDVSGFFTDPVNGGGTIAVLQGLATEGSQIGSSGNDLIDGRGEVDFIDAGGGDDIIRISQAAAHDPADTMQGAEETITGGEGNDTILFNPTVASTLTLSQFVTGVETIAVVGAHPTYVTTGTIAANIDASAATGVLSLNGNEGANALIGGAGDQTLNGNGGDDVLDGGLGDDTLLGGAGNDTMLDSAGSDVFDGGGESADIVSFSGNFADYTFALVAGDLLVTRDGITDTLRQVERISFADRMVLTVDGAGTASNTTTIQAAVNAAVSGETIFVLPGTYAENVTINKNDLTLLSLGGAENTIIAGNPAGGELGTIVLSTNTSGVRIGTIGQGFRVEGLNGPGTIEKAAIYLQGSHSGHVIQGNQVVAQGDAGLMSEFGGDVDDLTVDSNEFSGQTYTGSEPTQAGTFSTQFDLGNNLPRQLVVLGNGPGAGVSASTNTVFTNNLVSGSAGANAFGNTLVTIDVSNSTVGGNNFTGVTAGSGVALRMRRDGATITDNTLNGADGGDTNGMLIQNQTGSSFSGNLMAGGENADHITAMTPGADLLEGNGGDDILRAGAGHDTINGGSGDDQLNGEAGDDILNAGTGTDLLFGGEGNDSLTGGIDDDGPDQLNGGAGDDTIVAGSASTMLEGNAGADSLVGGRGDDEAHGGDGNDTLIGGEGNDVLDGGADLDTVSYAVTLTAADISAASGIWQVAAGADGTDNLDGIEIVEAAGGARFLLVGAGGYSTINAAISAANDGDTIRVSAGTYDEAVNVNKAVKILGANFGIDGDEARDDETIITGLSQVTAASGEVLISGIEFRYTGGVNSLFGSMNGGSMLRLTGGATVVVEDSRFVTTSPQGNADAGGGGRAIYIPTGFLGDVTIDGNFFGGPATSGFSGANWYRGVWSDGTAAGLTITDNVFNYIRSAINLDAYDDAPVSTIANNTISNSGSGISFGVNGDASPLGVSGNVFTNVGSDFNLQNLTAPVVFSVGDNTATAVEGDNFVVVLGGTAGDSLTGAAGDDILVGNNGADTLSGGDGNDILSGGAGNDILDGGDGADTASYTGETSFIRNFDGSIFETASGDILRNVEFASLNGGAAIDLAGLPGAVLTVQLTTDSGQDDETPETSNTTTFNGTGRAFTDVEITWHGPDSTTGMATVQANALGLWSFALGDLPQGLVTVGVVQQDDIGGSASAETSFIHDSETLTPTIVLVSDTGTDTSDSLTNDRTPTFSGTAEAGSTISIRLAGDEVGTATAGVDGSWEATIVTELGDGPQAFEARATDVAGNVATSAGLVVDVDGTAPVPLSIDLLAASDSAADSDDVTTDTTPTFIGAAETGTVVRLYAGEDLVGTTVAVAGAWEITSSALVDGTYAMTVQSEDAAGNTSSSGGLLLVVDTTDPVTPVLALVAGSDTGSEDTDNVTADNTPTFLVTGEVGTGVVVYRNAIVVASGVVGLDGTVELTTSPLGEGSGTFNVVSTDQAGNTAVSDALAVTVDTLMEQPTIDLDALDDSGDLATDDITSENQPSFSGTAEALSTVRILRDGALVGSVTADGAGAWNWTSGTLDDGSYSFQAVSLDLAGNEAGSTDLPVVIDTEAPAAPVLTVLSLTSVSGGTFIVSGAGESGTTVQVFADATLLGTVAVAAGVWSLTYGGTPLAAGEHILTATAADVAGNLVLVSPAYGLVVGALGAVLVGGAGADSLVGGDGADTLVGGTGGDTLDGGGGFDSVDYGATAGVFVDLATGTQALLSDQGTVLDRLVNVEAVLGSASRDFIYGDAANNLLIGNGGDDALDGGGGNDTVVGGAGADALSGGEGSDTASYAGDTAGVSVSLATGLGSGGHAEGDILFDFEALVGGSGNDALAGDAAANRLEGGGGNDTLLGGAGADLLFGGDGFDVASYAGSASVTVNLQTGVGSGAHAAGDLLQGIEGVTGGMTADILTGSSGDNVLSGEGGDDLLAGAGGNDTLNGGAGNDMVNGGDGLDMLVGGEGDDTLGGGNGNDVLAGGAGRDVMAGGAGADSFSYTAASDSDASLRDVISDFEAGDRIDLSMLDGNTGLAGLQGFTFLGQISSVVGATLGVGEVGFHQFAGNTYVNIGVNGDGTRDLLIELTGLKTLQASDFEGIVNVQSAGSAGNDSLAGTGGADALFGLSGNDTLAGGDGDDVLVGGAGRDIMTGGAGADVFIFTAASDSVAAGRDVVTDFEAGDRIDLSTLDGNTGLAGLQGFTFLGQVSSAVGATLGAGEVGFHQFAGNTYVNIGVDGDGTRDSLIELTGLKALQASDFAGIVNARLSGTVGNDSLTGTGGADTLTGLGGTDTLVGGEGDDVLVGGAGRDIMTGGAGADRFVYTATADSVVATRDCITDFGTGDRIDLAMLDGNTGLAGLQDFVFLGQVASGTTGSLGAGEVSFHQFAGNTYVNIGVDGDGVRDMMIELTGLKALQASDFVL